MRDILIITNYFPPETGAASNRIFQLAKGLSRHAFKVSIVTPLPNYPKGKIFNGYSGKFYRTTLENNIRVHRLWLYASNSKNKLKRLLAMLSYSLSLIRFFLVKKIPETVIIQSPPLVVAFTAMLFLRSKKRKLILNVSDLWPLAGLELGAFKRNWSYKILERMERFNYKCADLILGQSEEILQHVKSIFPQKPAFLYRNYPDFEVVKPVSATSTNRIRMVYAGLLGVAQGIHKLCTQLNYKNIEFHIYGEGAERQHIENFITINPDLPIYYHGEVSREELHKTLLAFDIAIIPLLNRIYGSVPSKIFEYARLGLPVLYFGGGEGEDIVMKYNLGRVVESGNYAQLNKWLLSLTASEIQYFDREEIQKEALKNFNFKGQMHKLIELI